MTKGVRLIRERFVGLIHERERATASALTSGFTLRALLIGTALSAAIGIGNPYGKLLIRGTYMDLPAPFLLFFVWLVFAQTLLGRIRRSLALTRGELIVIYVMMLVATATPVLSLMLFTFLSGALYYATSANNWVEMVLPYIPRWMIPQSEEAVRRFYEGLPADASIPWGAWTESLFWWLVLIGGFYLAAISLMVILRKQWVDHEHLIYPLARFPLAMLPEEGAAKLLPSFFKKAPLWIGLGLSFAVLSFNALHNYHPFGQPLSLTARITPFEGGVPLNFRLSFLILGFSYLIQTKVAFSLWVFYLLRNLEETVLSILGIMIYERLAPFSGWGGVRVILGHQTMGAMFVFVAVMLWFGREHLKQVLKKAFRGDAAVDDSGEILSYRGAVLGAFVGILAVGLWLWRAGLPLWIVPLFLLAAFTIFLALTRVIAETGLPTVPQRLIPSDVIVLGVGSAFIGGKGMIALASTFVWAIDSGSLMNNVAHGLKIGGDLSGDRRPLFGAIVLALVVSLAVSIATIGLLAYSHGATNLSSHHFVNYPRYPFDYAADRITHPEGPSRLGWMLTGIGGGVMGGLMLLQRYFLWWPLHPIGFIVSTNWVMNNIWFTILLAWLIKSSVLKYGGPKIYRKTVPFFMGLTLGHFIAAGFWLLVDGFLGRPGTRITFY